MKLETYWLNDPANADEIYQNLKDTLDLFHDIFNHSLQMHAIDKIRQHIESLNRLSLQIEKYSISIFGTYQEQLAPDIKGWNVGSSYSNFSTYIDLFEPHTRESLQINEIRQYLEQQRHIAHIEIRFMGFSDILNISTQPIVKTLI